jgi:hypothetical protein
MNTDVADLPDLLMSEVKTYWKHCKYEGDEPPWELKFMRDRGYIAIAKREFACGDIICIEKPIFWILSHSPTQDIVLEQVLKLDEDDKQAFYQLSNTSNDPLELGIYKTNAFDMTYSTFGESVGGLYPAIARLNHSCCPNVQQTHYPDTNEEYLHATRSIAIGDELNDSYIQLLQTRESRRKELLEIYGFECNCSACTVNWTGENDKERVKAFDLEELIIEVVIENGPADALDINVSLLRILEGINSEGWSERYRAPAHISSYQILTALGDKNRALISLQKAVYYLNLYEGKGSLQSRKFSKFIKA